MKRDFSLLGGHQFDLLVCGGGIYGAWIAYDAALRGLRVALVEQGDWACATSSASSKLIHGGLRYLESFDFKLVKKALAERKMLLKAAPHRVWPLRFGVPVYTHSRIGALQLRAGLALYDFFAGSLGASDGHHHFGVQDFSEHFPILNTLDLKGGFTYADAQTDDARLVLELVSGAMAAGAVCVNYCKLTDFLEAPGLEAPGLAHGATVQDQVNGTDGEIFARKIVNATGQWAVATKQGGDWCRLTKGVHLVMPGVLTDGILTDGVLADEALLLTAPSDGRVFFIIPWYGVTLLGTTDTDYSGNLDHVTVEVQDVDYLLAAANHYLNTAWTSADVINSYAGLRVLKRSDRASPSDVSRDWELKMGKNGVHYSIGGKITSAREDAASAVNTICAELAVKAASITKGRKFPWMPEEPYSAWSHRIIAQAMQLGIDRMSADWLVRRHGKRIAEIFHSIENDHRLAERIVPALPFIYADLLWSARAEMVVHLDDLLRRRMPLLILSKLTATELQAIASAVAPTLGWDEAALHSEIENCQPWLHP